MIQTLLIMAFLSSSPLNSAYASNPCANLLLGAAVNLQSDTTDKLIAYLSVLLEQRVIGRDELLQVIGSIEKGKILNPIQEDQTWTSSSAMIHREEIQKYLSATDLDANRLLEWLNKTLQEKEHAKIRREETRTETEDLSQKIEFNAVPPGTFQMSEGKYTENKKTVILSHPFELMSTPVTQKQWVELMGENPAHFVTGDKSISANVGGKSIVMQPNNPVERVSWWSAVEFANRLSVKVGLKPAYDLSGVKFTPGTRAEDGTLAAESGYAKINAPDEDIYQTLGFRLPTEAESAYVARAAGKPAGVYHFGDDVEELKNYEWYHANSNDKTHPVAELKPLVIDGKSFFDVVGNIMEWTNDWYRTSITGGYNPRGPRFGDDRCVFGSCYNGSSVDLRTGGHYGTDPGTHGQWLGFRLARTLPQEPGTAP